MIRQLLSFGALLVLASACASRNVNPAIAKARTGYVDISSKPAKAISWDILNAKPGTEKFKRAYSDVKPVEGILRIALPPGRYRLRINVLNHVITDPADIELEVTDGQITPVSVEFTEARSLSVPFTDPSAGGSVYRRQGRGSSISLYAASEYALSAVAQAQLPYKPKPLTNSN